MTYIVGVLGDSYRRTLRTLGERPAIDYLIEKATHLSREFGISPLGLDFGVYQLPSTRPSYLDELRSCLEESKLVPTVIVGSLNLHTDPQLSEPPLKEAIANLEVAHHLGSPLGLFYFGYGGRVTHQGRLRLAGEQIGRLADAAKAFGMAVTTENYDYFGSDDFLSIFRQLRRTNVGLHNDTGNWLILGEDPLTATRKLAQYTFHSHVRDYRLVDGVFSSVPLGQGQVAMNEVLMELRGIAERLERMVLAVEMDLDDGDEDKAVHECLAYMKDWMRGTSGQ